MLSGAIKGGIWGAHPDLGDLIEGDMQFTMDYRSVYASILSDWFKDPLKPLQQVFKRKSFINLCLIYLPAINFTNQFATRKLQQSFRMVLDSKVSWE